MNAMFDPVHFIHRPEAEGIARGAAKAIAQGSDDRNRDLATRADLEQFALAGGKELDQIRRGLEQFATRAELNTSVAELQTAMARQMVQFGAMLAAGIGLATAILSAVIALH